MNSAGWPVRSIARADVGNAAGDAGAGLVVHDHDRLDRVAAVLTETALDVGRVDAMTPIAG